jgi:hypothetical protein
LDSVVVHDPGGCLAGDVEVDLAAGFVALSDGGSGDPGGGEGLPEDLVVLAVVGAGVEVGDDRGDGASNGLDGGRCLPELAGKRVVGDRVAAWFEAPDRPGGDDGTTNIVKPFIRAEFVDRGLGGGGGCATDADGCYCRDCYCRDCSLGDIHDSLLTFLSDGFP